jgi:hypothetical protein
LRKSQPIDYPLEAKAWTENLPYAEIPTKGIIVVALAAKHGGRLATLDKGLASLHQSAFLIP